jgi:hypothetical protein
MIAAGSLVSIRIEAAAAVTEDRGVALRRALRWGRGVCYSPRSITSRCRGLRGQVDRGDLRGLAAGRAGGWRAVPRRAAVVAWSCNLLATARTLPNVTILGQTAGNLAEVVVIAILLGRLLGSGATVDRVDRLPRMLLAIAVGTAVSAVVGNLSLLAGGVIQWHAVPTTFRTWWLGDRAERWCCCR